MANLTMDEIRELVDIVLQQKQLILEGPPGAGKTFIADLLGRYLTENPLAGPTDESVVLIQFHQSYSYEDFIQGIRPETNERGQLEYHVRDGIFIRLCAVAAANPTRRFVVIIDEINRGNISRIFGEVLLLLEYRDKAVTLPYARPGDTFSIPPNIFLIGTMNTTDRSLAQIDYALRRRFYFARLMSVVDGQAPVLRRWLIRQGIGSDGVERLVRLFISLNERIQEHLGGQFQIGHSYLMQEGIEEPAVLERVWKRAVLPLIEEYFFNVTDRSSLLEEFSLERLTAP